MRIVGTAALLVLATVVTAAGARAQTTPEQTLHRQTWHRRHYGAIPHPTRHLGEIRPRQDRLGTLRGPQGSLIRPSPTPYFGSGFVMQATKKPPDIAPAADSPAQYSRRESSQAGQTPLIDRPNGVPRRILSCWSPPAHAKGDLEVTVRVSFSKVGDIIGMPRVTYVKAGNDDDLRKAVTASIVAAIRSCAPLRFTQGFGQAIAGRAFAIRFIAPAVRNSSPTI